MTSNTTVKEPYKLQSVCCVLPLEQPEPWAKTFDTPTWTSAPADSRVIAPCFCSSDSVLGLNRPFVCRRAQSDWSGIVLLSLSQSAHAVEPRCWRSLHRLAEVAPPVCWVTCILLQCWAKEFFFWREFVFQGFPGSKHGFLQTRLT